MILWDETKTFCEGVYFQVELYEQFFKALGKDKEKKVNLMAFINCNKQLNNSFFI